MKKHNILVAFLSLFAFCLSMSFPGSISCRETNPPPPPSKPAAADKDKKKNKKKEKKRMQKQFSESIMSFGCKALSYSYKNKDKKQNNIVISPLSLRMALDMTYTGAAGKTASEMAKALALPNGTNTKQIQEQNRHLIKSLGSNSNVILETANSLWIKQNFEVSSSFVSDCKKYFDAEVENSISIPVINKWVSEKTHNKIKDILSGSSSNMDLVLVNAVYFLGTWDESFDAKRTSTADFFVNDKTKMKVSAMRKKFGTNYLENDKFQCVELNYKGKDTAMYIFLPRENSSMNDFVKNFSPGMFEATLNNMRYEQVEVTLPKFKSEYEESMNKTLKQMGMKSAFMSSANFSLISKGLFISLVKHKTFIDVNEQGTEAAAATAVIMTKSMMPAPPKVFNVNRPFFFVIADKDSNVPLFIGAISKPVYK